MTSNFISEEKIGLKSACENIWVQLNLAKSGSILIGAYYKTLELDQPSFEEMNKSLQLATQTNLTIWLLGDFETYNVSLKILLQQGISEPEFYGDFVRRFRNFIADTALLEKYSVSLKTLLQQGISEPEFYGDLVYRFRKIVGKSNFSEQFRKLINRYKRIGYSLNIMRQTACLVVNPIIVDGYASLFNCTTAVRASDSMTASS